MHVADLLPLFLAQADDDRILVALLAVHRRLGAGDVRADGVRDAGDGEAEQRRLRTIDVDRQLRPAFVAPDPRVGDAGRAVHQRLRAQREPPRVVEVLAADFERQASAVVVAAREEPVHLIVAARGVGADDDAGQARQLPAQLHRDLLARPRPLVLRRQHQLDVAAVAAAAAGAEPEAPAPAVHDDRLRFGNQRRQHLLDPLQHRVGPLDPRADRELDSHVDLTFVGLGRQLGRNGRQDQHRRDHRRDAHARSRSAGAPGRDGSTGGSRRPCRRARAR